VDIISYTLSSTLCSVQHSLLVRGQSELSTLTLTGKQRSVLVRRPPKLLTLVAGFGNTASTASGQLLTTSVSEARISRSQHFPRNAIVFGFDITIHKRSFDSITTATTATDVGLFACCLLPQLSRFIFVCCRVPSIPTRAFDLIGIPTINSTDLSNSRRLLESSLRFTAFSGQVALLNQINTTVAPCPTISIITFGISWLLSENHLHYFNEPVRCHRHRSTALRA
jgi:hypothetical protein